MRAADVADLLKGLATDVREFVAQAISKFEERFAEVERQVREAPAPLGAKEIGTFVDDRIDGAMIDLIEPKLAPVLERLAAVEERAAIPGAPGEPGLPGEPGAPGKDVDDAALQQRLETAVEKELATVMTAIAEKFASSAGHAG